MTRATCAKKVNIRKVLKYIIVTTLEKAQGCLNKDVANAYETVDIIIILSRHVKTQNEHCQNFGRQNP